MRNNNIKTRRCSHLFHSAARRGGDYVKVNRRLPIELPRQLSPRSIYTTQPTMRTNTAVRSADNFCLARYFSNYLSQILSHSSMLVNLFFGALIVLDFPPIPLTHSPSPLILLIFRGHGTNRAAVPLRSA